MIQVRFIDSVGLETTVQGAAGDTIMQLAFNNGVSGILGECGGSMMCATCHCYVEPEWAEKAGPLQDGEDDMLEGTAAERLEFSRLSCQIALTPEMDGLTVRLPTEQI